MSHSSLDASKGGTTNGSSGAYRVTTRIYRHISQCSPKLTACDLHQLLVAQLYNFLLADLNFSEDGLTHLL